MKVFRPIAGWAAAIVVLFLRWTCRIHRHGDPRAELRARSRGYVYSVLHAHQLATVIGAERGTGAMVSRSMDGAILVPSLRFCGVVPVRGSSSKNGRDKGGRAAFQALIEHVVDGSPAYLAVDGPRGPRNRIHKGIALLSLKTGAAVVNVCAVPNRRWILSRAWDRLQIPKPFTTINVYFSEPIALQDGENAEQYRQRIEASLNELEREHDPVEAKLAQSIAAGRSMAEAA